MILCFYNLIIKPLTIYKFSVNIKKPFNLLDNSMYIILILFRAPKKIIKKN
uniref:Uncharacterized protein n=1 Tax=Polysiphonia sertularioides TaxID=945028 RepID=A0A1Z1MH42_9FLOR|nr:hypothetical protein [Polysiphonia sertularioides]